MPLCVCELFNLYFHPIKTERLPIYKQNAYRVFPSDETITIDSIVLCSFSVRRFMHFLFFFSSCCSGEIKSLIDKKVHFLSYVVQNLFHPFRLSRIFFCHEYSSADQLVAIKSLLFYSSGYKRSIKLNEAFEFEFSLQHELKSFS